jgi:succinyl-CoA synthetase beta subunit
MKLHEHQAKNILKQWGIPVPTGRVLTSPDQAAEAAKTIHGPPWVVKAQVHAGGRGKGGGVKVVHSPHEVLTAAESLIARPLVTPQTGPGGVLVHEVLVEEGVEIEREFYLGMVVDRSAARPAMIFSGAGGMDIEEAAIRFPESIRKELVDPALGWMPYQGRKLVYGMSPLPSPEQIRGILPIMDRLHRIFLALDCSLVEINPLAVTRSGQVIALDAKINIDDNALYRQKDLLELDDPREKDPLELMAERHSLNYIRLDGNIGAMVNGAGLAMATMDVIKAAGAEPANFLDVGGGASEEMISKGFEIILKDPRVKAILINIFGGIMRCDVLARGVLAAAREVRIEVPLIVRLEGTNAEQGREILQNSDLKFLVAKNIAEAARMVAQQV